MKEKILFICLAAWICCAEENRPPLVLLFSGSANGILRSCHCPSNPWGGLAKRAWLMDQLRAVAGADRVLALDSGDLFPVHASPGQAALLLKLYALMDYQAVAIGDQELTSGHQGWSEINKSAGFWDAARSRSTFPWLSGGYRFSAGDRKSAMLAPPWQVLERAGLRIGIVAVCGPTEGSLSSLPEGIALTRPSDTILNFRKDVRDRLDLVIVLSHQNLDEDRLLAMRSKGIDMIIGGHSQSLLSPPEVVNGVALCQAGNNGENLGVLLVEARPSTRAADAAAIGKKSPAQNLSPESPASCVLFQATPVRTPRWRITQQLIPLTAAIDESDAAARLISRHYAEGDAENAARLSVPDPLSTNASPQLTLDLPSDPVTLTAAEHRFVTMRITNRGNTPLMIKRVRSRSPWLSVRETPGQIAPSAEAVCRFEVSAEKTDRSFRCEFTVVSNDPTRPVIQGAFPGMLLGPLPQALDIAALWANMSTTAGPDPAGDTLPPEPLLADLARVRPPPGNKPARPLLVELFYAPGCEACVEIDQELLPETADLFEGLIDIQKHDVTRPGNYARLLSLQKKAQNASGTTLAVFVDGATPLFGHDAIRKNLNRVIDEALQKKRP